MKKSIALVALAFGVTSAFAQDLTSKKGEPILPEADDWSVGIDATPFLNYAGNFFGKTANNTAPTWNFFTNNQTITVKKFNDAQTAYRASVRLGFGGNTVKTNVDDRAYVSSGTNTFPNPVPQKENKWKTSSTNIGLAVGMEKRRGKTRLQGVYGAEAGIFIGTSKDKFTYGNTLNPTSTSTASPVVDPTAADGFAGFGNANVTSAAGLGIPGTTPGMQARLLEQKSGMTFAIGVRAFIGAEYFILPKMSLGGEFGWGIGYSMTGASKSTWETNGNTGAVGANDTTGSTEIKGSKTSGFAIDTDGKNTLFGPTGALRLSMYF